MSLIIVLCNISKLAPVSDYKYEVLVGDGTPEHSRTISHGRVKNHTRADGWQVLVKRLLQEEEVDV